MRIIFFEIIVWNQRLLFWTKVFLRGRVQLPKKNTEVQNNHQRIHTITETKMVQSYYCH